MIDIHSHLLPGVDDGVKTHEESVEIIKNLHRQGITDIIITPHYVSETTWTSSRTNNRILLGRLQNQLRMQGIPVNIYLGNEIYIDRDIEKLLKSYEISSLNDSKFLLIELPMSGEFTDWEAIITDLLLKGYRVILAHPERYHSFQKNPEIIEDLADNGVLFQCNLGSFIGQYGQKPKQLAKKMAKYDLIFALGTDIHHQRNYDEIKKALKKLKKYYNDAELDQILDKNPRQILRTVIK